MIKSSADFATIHAIVHGRVQGVSFRASTVHIARRLGLTGWVRNRFDGTVETLATGTRKALQEFIAYLHAGPIGAHVSQVDLDWPSTAESFDEFDITYTE